MKRIILLCLLSVIGLMTLQGCTSDEDLSVSDTRFVMGTVVTLQLYGTDDSIILDNAYGIIESIEMDMSLNVEDSEINQINKSGKIEDYEVSEEIFYVIQKSMDYSELSNGGFDITLEPVISLWNIGTEDAQVPAQAALTQALSYVGYEQIELDASNMTITMPESVSIDLGGIGKGYAADQVASYLKSEGVEKAIVNIGGNILVIGSKDDGSPFRVGLQNPFEGRNDYFAVVEVEDQTVVTSGIYERNFEEDGVLYHHILSTIDGYPVNNQVVSITVIADESIDADGLSTVLFIEGIEDGLKMANSIDGVECVYVNEESEVYLSDGAKAMVEISDEAFVIMN